MSKDKIKQALDFKEFEKFLLADTSGNGGFVSQLCYTVWELCHNPKHEDGNTDWSNDTLPIVLAGNEKIREALTALDALHTYDPATHVAVPREPTDDILNAILHPLELGNAHDVYEAMISAAQGDK